MALLGQNHGKSCHCQANRKKSGHLKKNHATVRVFEKKLGQRKKNHAHVRPLEKKIRPLEKKIMALLGQFRKKSRHC